MLNPECLGAYQRATSVHVTSTLSAFLRAAQEAYAFVRDALVSVIDNAFRLFRPTTVQVQSRVPMELPPPPRPTSPPISTAARVTRATRTATRRAASSVISTTTATRRSTAASIPGSQYHASATSSICETMRVIVTEAEASGTPLPSTVSSIQSPDVLPVFDELLLPLAGQPRTAAARAIRYENFAHNVDFRATLAQRRIEVATMMRETPSSNFVQDPADFACGCGFCPNGTSAYPLCVAVTIRRTIRNFGSRDDVPCRNTCASPTRLRSIRSISHATLTFNTGLKIS